MSLNRPFDTSEQEEEIQEKECETMKEIERILNKYECYTDECAKAIEQYVIKARIEELNKIYKEPGNFVQIDERIRELEAELKKGLSDEG